VICNEKDADDLAKVTTDEKRVLHVKTGQRSSCVGSEVGWTTGNLWGDMRDWNVPQFTIYYCQQKKIAKSYESQNA